MPYTATTVATSASPAAGIVTAIENALSAHSAWTFVEEVTQTDVHRIWKCAGSQNIAGTDFHLALVKPATATTLGFKVFEGWNTSTKRMHRPAPYSVLSAVPVTADLTTGATEVMLTDTSTAGRPHYPTKTSLPTTADHLLHIFVTKSRLVVVDWTSSFQFTLIAGAFPVQSGITDARFKNIALSLGATATSAVGSTQPTGSTSDTPVFTRSAPVGVASCWTFAAAPASMLREGAILTTTATAADPMTSRFLASDVAVLGPITSSSQAPGYRGTWPDAVSVASATAGNPGDTLLGPSSTEYVLLGGHGLSSTLGYVALSKTLADT